MIHELSNQQYTQAQTPEHSAEAASQADSESSLLVIEGDRPSTPILPMTSSTTPSPTATENPPTPENPQQTPPTNIYSNASLRQREIINGAREAVVALVAEGIDPDEQSPGSVQALNRKNNNHRAPIDSERLREVSRVLFRPNPGASAEINTSDDESSTQSIGPK